MFPTDVVILAGARTPMARYNGAFADTTAIDLGALASKEAIRRSGVDSAEIDHVVFGNVHADERGRELRRASRGIEGRAKVETPAVTVNRLCGSGMEAITQAAQRILLGEAKMVLAGGMENMTQCPHVIRGARLGFDSAKGSSKIRWSRACWIRSAAAPCPIRLKIWRSSTRFHGANRMNIALRSQQLAEAAFRGMPHERRNRARRGEEGREDATWFSHDDHRRPDTTMEILAALPPAFRKDGIVTAGNASGIVDGAAAVVVTHGATAKERGWRPLGRIVSWASAGVEPRIMGIGPVPSSQKALALAGLKLDQMDLVEVNEAFAPQYLAVEKALGLNRDKTNVNGGAIALGHPLARRGTRLVLTLLLELRRRGPRYGLATACIGGGQGIAMIVESLS